MKAADALDRVLAGEDVDAPEEVRELAELAALLQGAFQDGPTPASTGRVRTAALAAFQEAPAAPAVPSIVRARPTGGRRLAARMALVAALVAGLPTAAWAVSEESLPGDVLYPVKRGFEEARLFIAGDAAHEAEVLLDMVEERLEEAVHALGQGLDSSIVNQALAGYEAALSRFEERIEEAQVEGLAVGPLLEEAGDLAVIYEELFEVPPPAPGPAEPAGKAKGDGGPGKAKGKGGGGNGNSKGNRGSGGNGGNNAGGGGQSGSSGGSGGSGGGNAGGGGGGNAGGGGVGDGKEEQPPASVDDGQDEHDDEGSGSGSGYGKGDGEGLGHEIGKGKGHDKHDDDEN